MKGQCTSRMAAQYSPKASQSPGKAQQAVAAPTQISAQRQMVPRRNSQKEVLTRLDCRNWMQWLYLRDWMQEGDR